MLCNVEEIMARFIGLDVRWKMRPVMDGWMDNLSKSVVSSIESFDYEAISANSTTVRGGDVE
jgi:hypothetical protein